MSESHFQTLLIVRAHLINPLFVHILTRLIMEISKELRENISYPFDNLWSLNPHWSFASHIFKVKNFINLVLIEVILDPSLPHSLHLDLPLQLIIFSITVSIKLIINKGIGNSLSSLFSSFIEFLFLFIQDFIYLPSLKVVKLFLSFIINSLVFISVKLRPLFIVPKQFHEDQFTVPCFQWCLHHPLLLPDPQQTHLYQTLYLHQTRLLELLSHHRYLFLCINLNIYQHT